MEKPLEKQATDDESETVMQTIGCPTLGCSHGGNRVLTRTDQSTRRLKKSSLTIECWHAGLFHYTTMAGEPIGRLMNDRTIQHFYAVRTAYDVDRPLRQCRSCAHTVSQIKWKWKLQLFPAARHLESVAFENLRSRPGITVESHRKVNATDWLSKVIERSKQQTLFQQRIQHYSSGTEP